MTVIGAGAERVFSVMTQQPAQMDALAQSAISSGIGYYQHGKYAVAVREFKRAISLSPQSENTLNAYDYLAMAFLKLGNNKEAIKAYQSALRLSPNQDDFHNKLGNIFLEEGDIEQAIKSFQSALRVEPSSTAYLYSLGQAYLAKGSLDDARLQFEKIIKLAPQEYGGYYGLGQTYYKAGDNQSAIEQFEKVINLKEDFLYPRMDLGYALTDLGRIDEAYEQANILQEKDPSLAATLNSYIYQTSKPEFLIAYSDTDFNTTLGPRTPISALDSYLSSPNASTEFTMKFIFNKKMDIASIENPYNWRISRATPQIKGGPYNWGMPIFLNEINISLFPERVNYDFQNNTAVVTFRIAQNDLGNGTLDPSHIVFQFLGQDTYGNKMNPAADQYSGISKIV
jgi:tetratricopeptide (TPR) repeat protein